MGNAHLNDIRMRMKSSVFSDNQRMQWVVVMTDPVSHETYHFKYDYHVVTSSQAALRHAMQDFNNMWYSQDV